MIAIISDLHLEEEACDVIHGHGRHPDLIFRRNLNPRAYSRFIEEMAEQAESRRVKDFHLVIAGDLFDFNRTALWFRDSLRPYVSFRAFTPALESKLLGILEATAAECRVQETLDTLRLLAQGRYRHVESGKEGDFPARHIHIHYLPGNHDRLSNATSGVRKRINELLGLKGDKKFPHWFFAHDPAVLIRHGHEYDPTNFGSDFSKSKSIPQDIREEHYDEPNFGDFAAIDIAGRLPFLFRKRYGEQQILEDRVMASLYLRLLQFDDVRPQSALLDYLLDTSNGHYSAEEAWERLVPVIQELLDEIHNNKFFQYWLAKRASLLAPAELKVAHGLLKMGGWRNRAAREATRKIAHYMMGGDIPRPEMFAMREKMVQKKKVRLVVAGHTHHPEIRLIASDSESDRFYVNTGTWRNRIPATPDERSFGRLKALTYVTLFPPSEDPTGRAAPYGTFDYWSGYTRHFTKKNQ